jgi:hypothetical protein
LDDQFSVQTFIVFMPAATMLQIAANTRPRTTGRQASDDVHGSPHFTRCPAAP